MATKTIESQIMGRRIRKEREANEWKRAELGRLLGISGQAVGRYETGERIPKDEILREMAHLFSCSLDYLFGLSDVREPLNEEECIVFSEPEARELLSKISSGLQEAEKLGHINMEQKIDFLADVNKQLEFMVYKSKQEK